MPSKHPARCPPAVGPFSAASRVNARARLAPVVPFSPPRPERVGAEERPVNQVAAPQPSPSGREGTENPPSGQVVVVSPCAWFRSPFHLRFPRIGIPCRNSNSHCLTPSQIGRAHV